METPSNTSIEETFQFVVTRHPDAATVHLDMEEAGGDAKLAVLITEREMLFRGAADPHDDRDLIREELNMVMQEIVRRKEELGITD